MLLTLQTLIASAYEIFTTTTKCCSKTIQYDAIMIWIFEVRSKTDK